uniref:Uncharacterized protein n=1 Tax=Arundo donax TaxID=35708 RepID=A0A0A8ZT99_ARUDO
MSIWLQIEKSV